MVSHVTCHMSGVRCRLRWVGRSVREDFRTVAFSFPGQAHRSFDVERVDKTGPRELAGRAVWRFQKTAGHVLCSHLSSLSPAPSQSFVSAVQYAGFTCMPFVGGFLSFVFKNTRVPILGNALVLTSFTAPVMVSLFRVFRVS